MRGCVCLYYTRADWHDTTKNLGKFTSFHMMEKYKFESCLPGAGLSLFKTSISVLYSSYFFFRFHVKPVQSDQPLLPLCCQTRTTTKYRIICLSVKLQREFFFKFLSFSFLFYFRNKKEDNCENQTENKQKTKFSKFIHADTILLSLTSYPFADHVNNNKVTKRNLI